jgi:hypothetical protein
MTSWSAKFYEPIMIIILKFSIPECMCSKYIFAKSTVTIWFHGQKTKTLICILRPSRKWFSSSPFSILVKGQYDFMDINLMYIVYWGHKWFFLYYLPFIYIYIFITSLSYIFFYYLPLLFLFKIISLFSLG